MSMVNTDGGAGAMVLTTVKYGRLRLSRLRGAFGILDPSYETIREQINRLRDLGRLTWERRLRRDAGTGWRAEQASNAYCLLPFSCDADRRPGVRFVLKEGRKAAPKA